MNRALGILTLVMVVFVMFYFFLLICIFITDIGSGVIDRIRIDLFYLYFKFICNPTSTRSRRR